MELINLGAFAVLGALIMISALGVVFARNIVHSAVSLIVTFLSIAGIFILLNADFLGISQIIIYGVGITIVLIFAIMLTGKESDKKLWIAFKPRTLVALAVSFLLFVMISFAITDGFTKKAEDTGIFNVTSVSTERTETVEKLQQEGTAAVIGKSLFTKYVLPFEVLSLLLLAVILGAVVVAKKNKDNLVNPTTDLNLNGRD